MIGSNLALPASHVDDGTAASSGGQRIAPGRTSGLVQLRSGPRMCSDMRCQMTSPRSTKAWHCDRHIVRPESPPPAESILD